MVNKKFDQALHDEFDELGREMSKKFYKRFGFDLKDNPDQYGIDLIAYRDDKKVGYVEVEVRTFWTGNKFPFPTLNIPERKRKLLKQDLPIRLLSWSSHGDYGFMCKADVILNANVIERPNKFMAEKEYFFAVPVNKIRLIKL